MQTRTCNVCQVTKPFSDYRLSANGNPYYKTCSRCKYDKRNERRRKEYCTVTQKEQDLMRKYGITLEQYDAMLDEQENKCAICFVSFKGVRDACSSVVDHDHQTGKVRGILCNSCNRGLGLMDDNIEVLKNAVAYLQESL